jgi:Thoeris protein ThsB, TIR-like domain
MPDSKVVFIAFAKEDEQTRILFSGQRIHPRTPFSFTDMSVKEPYASQWKERVRTRIRRSDGVIVLISSSTPKATGQLWEIKCAVEEEKPLLGVWIEKGYRTKPLSMAKARCIEWSWDSIARFIDSL